MNNFLFPLFSIFFISTHFISAQNPCESDEPKTLEAVVSYFNRWSNENRPGEAYLHYFLNTDVESEEFTTAAERSLSRFTPYIKDYRSLKSERCLIPKEISNKLSGGNYVNLHYGIILPHSNKNLIILFMMDEQENLGCAILDKNYKILHPWEADDIILGTYIYDIEFTNDHLKTHSFGGLMSDITSNAITEYEFSVTGGVEIKSSKKFDKTNPFVNLQRIDSIPNMASVNKDNVISFFEDKGLKAHSVAYYETGSGNNIIFNCLKFDKSNFTFRLGIFNRDGSLKGNWIQFHYFGSEDNHSQQSDILIENKFIKYRTKTFVDGIETSDLQRIFKINYEGFTELLPYDLNLNEIKLPFNLSVKSMTELYVDGLDSIMNKSKELNQEQSIFIFPDLNCKDNNYRPIKAFKFIVNRIKVVAAIEEGFNNMTLHFQILDNNNKAIGDQLDVILYQKTDDGLAGFFNNIQLNENGKIVIHTKNWTDKSNSDELYHEKISTFEVLAEGFKIK